MNTIMLIKLLHDWVQPDSPEHGPDVLIHYMLLHTHHIQDGFINALAFSHHGDFLVAAVGQEHKLGRWWRDKKSRNSVTVISLKRKQE